MALLRWSFLGFAILLCHAATADESADARKIAGYLNAAWERDDATKSAELYAKLGKAREDERAIFARALIAADARRYDEASESLALLIKANDKHLAGLRLKTWIELLTKKYPAAISSAKSLGVAIAASKEAESDQSAEAVRFLGSVFGFISGPLADSPLVSTRDAAEKVVLAELNEEQKKIFKEARQGVVEKFTSLTTERADVKEEAVDSETKEKETQLADIGKRRGEMEKTSGDLKSRRADVQKELKSELDDIAKQDRPLQTELARYQGQYAVAQAELDSLAIQLGRLQADLAREKDPDRRRDLRRAIDSLRPFVVRADGQLLAVERLISDVQARRATLATRQAQVERDFGGQINSIDRQLNSFITEGRKLDNLEKRARKPATGRTGKAGALGLTTTALNTYEPFPFEEEKERLLDHLR